MCHNLEEFKNCITQTVSHIFCYLLRPQNRLWLPSEPRFRFRFLPKIAVSVLKLTQPYSLFTFYRNNVYLVLFLRYSKFFVESCKCFLCRVQLTACWEGGGRCHGISPGPLVPRNYSPQGIMQHCLRDNVWPFWENSLTYDRYIGTWTLGHSTYHTSIALC